MSWKAMDKMLKHLHLNLNSVFRKSAVAQRPNYLTLQKHFNCGPWAEYGLTDQLTWFQVSFLLSPFPRAAQIRVRSELQAGGIVVAARSPCAMAFFQELPDCWTIEAVQSRAGEPMEVQLHGGKAHAPDMKKEEALLQFTSSIWWIILFFKLPVEKMVFWMHRKLPVSVEESLALGIDLKNVIRKSL